MVFNKTIIKDNIWVITETNKDYLHPQRCVTGTFDTETFVYFDNKIISQEEIFERTRGLSLDEKRQRITSKVWCWQFYDEKNGFFMTNDFYNWLYYLCLTGVKYVWCYNAKFDFSQIDYELLANRSELWKQHTDDDGKGQGWRYSSLHNDMGARYSYKLWLPYKRKGRDVNRHTRVHAVDLRDFMAIMPGGLKRCLQSLEVTDNNGNKIRKLEMDYQNVDINNLQQHEIDYCCNDVKGLYFAIKKYNTILEEQSNGEDSIFGANTNILTAGGIAKKALLRELYPNIAQNKRLKQFQKQHPITIEQDNYFRKNGLYRGGICLVNSKYQGRMLDKPMYRYDVNSEYPFAMSEIFDLKGKAIIKSFSEWIKMKDKANYECIYMLDFVCGELKPGMVATWYDPFHKTYVTKVDEHQLHLIFEQELNEMMNWYDLDYGCEKVILFKRGEKIYKPFVEKYYKLKAQAKRENNPGLTLDAKLKLNSSYGKLSERLVRQNGFYAQNPETGAIHFVRTEEEIDESSRMSVVVGSLITSIARIWILKHIRKICKNVAEDFVYIDTDSIHCFCNYAEADPYRLGALKLEAVCCNAKYLAPKTYIDIEKNENGVVTEFECHTKGLNVNVLKKILKNKTIEEVDQIFNYGQSFKSLQAINVIGGKALILCKKYLAIPELAPTEFTTFFYNSNYNDNIQYEI